MYYKELAPRIMEAEKSQDLPAGGSLETGAATVYTQTESWEAPGPRRADVSVRVQRQENTHKTGRRIPLLPVGGSAFLFYSGL